MLTRLALLLRAEAIGLMVVTEEAEAVGPVVEEGEDIRLLLIHFRLRNKTYIIIGRAIGLDTGDQ